MEKGIQNEDFCIAKRIGSICYHKAIETCHLCRSIYKGSKKRTEVEPM